MEAVFKVNRMFLTREDWRGVLAIFLCLLIRGKATAMLSEVSRRRLSSFTASGSDFTKAIVSYIGAVIVLSPMDVLFNELVARLKTYWSHKLTMAMANTMVSNAGGCGRVDMDDVVQRHDPETCGRSGLSSR